MREQILQEGGKIYGHHCVEKKAFLRAHISYTPRSEADEFSLFHRYNFSCFAYIYYYRSIT